MSGSVGVLLQKKRTVGEEQEEEEPDVWRRGERWGMKEQRPERRSAGAPGLRSGTAVGSDREHGYTSSNSCSTQAKREKSWILWICGIITACEDYEQNSAATKPDQKAKKKTRMCGRRCPLCMFHVSVTVLETCVCVCYLRGRHNRNISFLSTCRCAEEKHVHPELLGRSCFLSLRNSAAGCFYPPDPSSLPEITDSSFLSSQHFNLRPFACCPRLRSPPLQTLAGHRWDPAANVSQPALRGWETSF